jgi:hypothetical protein
MAADLGRYGARTGRWWLPLVVVLMAAAVVVAVTVKAVVGPTLYVLF